MAIVKEAPGKGRGLFAERDYRAGDLIETNPAIVVAWIVGVRP
jgi:hypothetical protein